MVKFSANIGFLYSDLPFLERIQHAARDGFDGIECHWPYDVPAQKTREVMAECDLPLLGLNTSPGDLAKGDFGLAALRHRREEAKAAIRQGIDYGAAIGAMNLHVMAGYSDGGSAAQQCFEDNLRFACDLAGSREMSILIEPLNPRDHAGYHLSSTSQAAEIIDLIGAPNLKMMFDCYHVQIAEGELMKRLRSVIEMVGHVQIAGIPDRHEPDQGEVDMPELLSALAETGYAGWVGAEYRPKSGKTREGLGWLSRFREALRGVAQS